MYQNELYTRQNTVTPQINKKRKFDNSGWVTLKVNR